MSQPDQRIVITGTGLATVFGVGRDATWRAVRAGRCGLAAAPALVADEDDTAARGTPVEIETLRAVGREAIEEAGLAAGDGRRVGVVLGTTLHGIRGAGRYLRTGDAGRLGEVPAARVVRDAFEGLGIEGPHLTTCSACSSGLASVALGVTLLRAGLLDVAIVGGYDPIAEYSAAGFASLRLVTGGRPRPFCRDREGLRLGPGYAVLVLERASEAASRGAGALAEVLGWGERADAFHLTRPHPEGRGAIGAMREALARAGVGADRIDLVGAHATGTPANDAAEHAALREVLGERLSSTPVVAFKAHVGHTLGAAGAVELVLSLLSMREGVASPTPGIGPGEVEFDGLGLVTGEARRAPIKTTMSLSIGFGGANACVVLGTPGDRRPEPPGPDVEVAITGIGMVAPGAPGNDRVLALRGRDAPIGGPIEPADLEPLIAEHRLRRQSEYSRLTIGAAGLALADAGIPDRASFAEGCGVVLGTAHGSAAYSEAYYREIVEHGPAAGNPMLFAEGVPNAGAAQLSIAFGITGGCQTIVGSRTSGLEALALAALRVRRGEWRRAIIGAAEEFSETVNAGYEACGLTGDAGGFVAGAGAGAMVIERLDDARARGARVLATVGRFGLAFAPAPGAAGVSEAIGRVLEEAGADADVIGSANGTWVDDAERLAVRRRLGEDHYRSMRSWLAEMFAAGPLIRLGVAIADERGRSGGPGLLTGLCVDPLGAVAAVSVRRG